MKRRRAADRESGFALLLVFAMAAIVSVMLYLELPRVAFEAQRVREQTLIDRGEQYVRAIKLYMRKFPGKYPATIDQLENTNNIRFLRRRYKDPMTGTDDWRIIHAGPGGVLTDSLVQKPPQLKQDNNQSGSIFGNSTGSSFGSGFGSQMGSNLGSSIGTPIGSSSDTSSDSSNVPVRSAIPPTRPSQMSGQINMPGMPGSMMPGGMQSGQMNSGDPTQQDQTAGQYPSGVQPGQPVQFQPGQPGQQPGQPYPYSSGQPGQSVPLSQIGQPGQPYPNAPGTQPGQPSYGQVPGQPSYGPGIPVLPNAPTGMNPPTPTNSGSFLQSPPVPGNTSGQQQPPGGGPGSTPVPDMIGNMLRQPRSQTTFGSPGQTIGGGIAGVATKFEATGIKLYNDRAKYNEWEFVYDPRKDMTNPLMSGPQLGMQPQLGNSPQTGFQPSPTSPGPR